MKHLLLLCMMLWGLVTGLVAQPDGTIHAKKMKVFAYWPGKWQGISKMQTGPGDPQNAVVDEIIQSKLDGTILLVEGTGRIKNEQTQEENIVHHAIGILSYDNNKGEYKFKSYLKNGRSTDAWFAVVEENKYQWGFDAANVKMRYFITLDPIQNTWNEIGEFSRDGGNWTKVFEMNLKKIE